MIKPGAEIENPVTGERLVFRKTSTETNGAAVVIETFLRPYAIGTRAHLHPFQEERFEVLHGSIGLRLGDKQLVAGPGQRFTARAGTPHRLWNAGDEEAHLVSEIRPALQFEELVATIFALAADGKTNRSGTPTMLRLAVIAQTYFDTARLPTPSPAVQRLGVALAAPLGRLLRHQPVYQQATPSGRRRTAASLLASVAEPTTRRRRDR
jgi:mannose-6-phosphate isomerase-like protein (cupin superfamily)